MILAQATTGSAFWLWVEHLGLICTIVVAITAVLVARRKKERRRIEPDPLRIRKMEVKATEANCKERHMLAMSALSELRKDHCEAHERIYDQIDLAEKRGADALAGALKEINETFRLLPGELIKLLKDTGQLTDHRSDL